MTVVLSIGGSVFVPDLDPDRIGGYASAIAAIAEAGEPVAAVVGGGPVARDYIEAARTLGATEMELDRIGIGLTRLNARLLAAALAGRRGATPTLRPPTDYETAHAAIRRGEVPVMGGTEPAHTTDAVSAALAEDLGADLLVFATSAAGVYEADPAEDAGARRFDEIRAGTLVRTVAGLGSEAGAKAPVDLLAAKILQRAGTDAVVLDGTDPDRVRAAVLGDDFVGTRIVPDGAGTDRLADDDPDA